MQLITNEIIRPIHSSIGKVVIYRPKWRSLNLRSNPVPCIDEWDEKICRVNANCRHIVYHSNSFKVARSTSVRNYHRSTLSTKTTRTWPRISDNQLIRTTRLLIQHRTDSDIYYAIENPGLLRHQNHCGHCGWLTPNQWHWNETSNHRVEFSTISQELLIGSTSPANRL